MHQSEPSVNNVVRSQGPRDTAPRNRVDPAAITARVSLAELLSRSIEDDPTTDEPFARHFDDDEGSSGG